MLCRVCRAFVLLIWTVAVSACGADFGTRTADGPFARSGSYEGKEGAAAPSDHVIAILLPLSGSNAPLGGAMLNAARLALAAPGAPRLDAFDTAGTPHGAAAAVRQAIAAGAGLLLGPLTAAETAEAGPLAIQSGIAMIAFTSDATQAHAGLWTLGITARQQVEPLAAAARALGRDRIAGLVPNTEYGHAFADALSQAAVAQGLTSPTLQTYPDGFSAINTATRELSAYSSRRGPLDSEIRSARARGDAEGRRLAAELARQPIPQAPFDALLLAETGEKLTEILSLLPYYDIDPPKVQLLGPALWGASTAQLLAARGMAGAWFAAPDPSARQSFEQTYRQTYSSDPPPLADIAYDAAVIAGAVTQAGRGSTRGLSRSEGFPGVDGPLILEPDGRVVRGLALFQVERGGATMIKPAPAAPSASGT